MFMTFSGRCGSFKASFETLGDVRQRRIKLQVALPLCQRTTKLLIEKQTSFTIRICPPGSFSFYPARPDKCRPLVERKKRNFFEWKMFGVWIKHDMNCKCSPSIKNASPSVKRSASVSSFFLIHFMFYICNQEDLFSSFNDKNMAFCFILTFLF